MLLTWLARKLMRTLEDQMCSQQAASNFGVCPKGKKVIACSKTFFPMLWVVCCSCNLAAYAVAMEIQFSQLQDISIVGCLHIQLLAVSVLPNSKTTEIISAPSCFLRHNCTPKMYNY